MSLSLKKITTLISLLTVTPIILYFNAQAFEKSGYTAGFEYFMALLPILAVILAAMAFGWAKNQEYLDFRAPLMALFLILLSAFWLWSVAVSIHGGFLKKNLLNFYEQDINNLYSNLKNIGMSANSEIEKKNKDYDGKIEGLLKNALDEEASPDNPSLGPIFDKKLEALSSELGQTITLPSTAVKFTRLTDSQRMVLQDNVRKAKDRKITEIKDKIKELNDGLNNEAYRKIIIELETIKSETDYTDTKKTENLIKRSKNKLDELSRVNDEVMSRLRIDNNLNKFELIVKSQRYVDLGSFWKDWWENKINAGESWAVLALALIAELIFLLALFLINRNDEE